MQKVCLGPYSMLLFLTCFLQAPVFAQHHHIGTTDSCEQAKVAIEKANRLTTTSIFLSALHTINDSTSADPAHEHIVSFGRNEQGEIIASLLITGGKSNSIVPKVPNAFADLHNHPNGTPPSSGDLYGLLQQFQKDKNYCMRFVLVPGGGLYALVVSDTAAAGAFREKFPPQQTVGYSPLFPDSLLTEYREILYRYGAREEVVMAYLLEKYSAGVSLLKREDGVFKVVRTIAIQTGNQLVFVANDCP